jgi:cell division protein FtsW
MAKKKVDSSLVLISSILIIFGLAVFTSATFGLIARDTGGGVFWLLIKQLISLGLGLILFGVGLRTPLSFWRKYGFYIFIAGCATTLMVFLPQIGQGAKGAQRWLDVGPLTFQPVEFLKLGYILYLSALFAANQKKITDTAHGLLPFLGITGIVSAILLAQPNTGMFVVLAATGVVIYLVAGGRWKHLFIIGAIGVLILGGIIATRPYVRDRFVTFFTPHQVDEKNEGYQVRQSLIAIGSGGVFGKGFGQSVQKFKYLPEPIGDSIFAVLSEELGFIGSALTVFLFLGFSLLGLKIAVRAPDMFSRLLATGIVILIAGQSFLNIAAMLNLIPLSGVPILFISQGGSALMFALFEIGILLNISRYQEY